MKNLKNMFHQTQGEEKIKDKFLSVVMPVYDEEFVIEKVVREFCKDVLDKFEEKEFIVVNDSSKDNTLKILKNLEKEITYLKIIDLEKNSGHGIALRTAYDASRGDLIFHCDSDDQYNPKNFWLLLQIMKDKDLDVVLGHRKNRHDPFNRLIVTRLLRAVIFLLHGVFIIDANTSFKIHRRESLEKILSIVPNNFSQISATTAVTAKKLKMNMAEIPIDHRPRVAGTPVLVNWRLMKTCLRGFKELFIIRDKIRLARKRI